MKAKTTRGKKDLFLKEDALFLIKRFHMMVRGKQLISSAKIETALSEERPLFLKKYGVLKIVNKLRNVKNALS